MSEQPTKKKERFSPGGYFDGVVYEQIIRPDSFTVTVERNPVFRYGTADSPGGMAYARSDEPNRFDQTFERNRVTYKPLPVHRVSWKLPPEPINYKDEVTLFNEVKTFLYDYYELRDFEAYDVWAGLCLASQLIEKWDAVPYLCFMGPRRTGKSTALRISKQVFRRCVGGPAVSAAWIASVIDRYDASVVSDEQQLWKSEDKSEHHAILRGGYQRDMPRYKMISTGRGFTDVEQKIFGIKLIGSELPVEAGIMERCILIHTVKRTRKLGKLRQPEFALRGLDLRGKLLTYRMRHLGQPVSDDIDSELEEIREDRTQELAYPILASTPVQVHDSILSFFREQETRLQTEEQTGEFADYVRAVADCVANSKIEAGGIILLKNFRDSLMKVAEVLDVKFLDSPKKNRRILDSLAFKRARTNEGVGFIYDDKRQKELEAQFSPTPVEPTQPTQPTLEKEMFEREVKVVKDVKVSGGVGQTDDSGDLAVTRTSLGCPVEGCKIGPFPDKPALDSHLSTYKHA